MAARLADKVAIVTGGVRGLGRAIVEQFNEQGARVVVADVLEEEGTALATELGDGVSFERLDVSDEANWRGVVDSCATAFGRLDILVNNAGVVGMAPLHEETLEGFERVMSVNSTGVFLGMREAVRVMLGQGGGAIVNVSSTWGLVGAPGAAAYHASKGAVTVMTKNAAVTYAGNGIRVNSIHPGPMQTAIADEVGEEGMKATADRTPMRRVSDPSEVAGAAVYLASDEASFTTGASLLVDGGYTAI